MKSSRFLAVLVALVLIVVAAVETGQTQGPTESEPVPAQSGTAGTRPENPRALTDGSGRQEEDAVPDPAAGSDATLRIPVAALNPRESNVEWSVGAGAGGSSSEGSGRFS